MKTWDNNRGQSLDKLKSETDCIEDLQKIGNKSIQYLYDNNPNLLVFPLQLGDHKDGIESKKIFTLHNDILTTDNLMGFVGRNNTQLTISSRFAKDDKHDYFLHYMLQKVFALNILDVDQTPNKENIWDFLLYLFPFYLKRAMAQGLYKEYKRNEYNDANVKVTIDVKRHIRINIPFAGKIAYSTREYSHDNSVTQLVRHTIEYIKTHPFGSGVLNCDSDTRDAVSQIRFYTPSYNHNNRQKIINTNLKPVSHPYFTEYKMLQKICLRILRREKLTFGEEKNKIYGVLFDGAWLWEEYLNVVLHDNKIAVEHPQNKKHKGGDYLFKDGQRIYPDFIKRKSKNSADYVADAKYKPIDNKSAEAIRTDYYQVITYMYRYNCDLGYILFPYDGNENYMKKRIIVSENEKDNESEKRKIIELGLPIPQSENSFEGFKTEMKLKETSFSSRFAAKQT
jgi:5-methylcytosine-specific restriction endonuclease McrBC regulatory subunit McrC